MHSNVKLNIILVLDENSRRKMKSHLGDLGFKGVEVISSLQEITKEMLIKTKKVVLLEKFLTCDGALDELNLYKEVYNLDYIYLGTDSTYNAVMKHIARCHKIDISYLNYETLHAVALEDLDIIEREESEVKEVVDEYYRNANRILQDPSIADGSRRVADSCIHLIDMVNYLSSELDVWKARAKQSNLKVSTQQETVDRVLHAHADLLKRAYKMDKNLEQYETILSKNVYTKIMVSNYENPPIVLYFKNYQELIHLESFILTLYNAIRVQLRLSCKILRLYDNSASVLLKPVKQRYQVLHNKFNVDSIYRNDFLVKYGDYSKVLDLLFENELQLDVLLIFDFKDKDDIVTLGNSATYNMCRNETNIDFFNLTKSNTIVNNSYEGNRLSWNTYEEYYELRDEEERLLHLANKPVIKDILKNIEMCTGGI